MFRRDQRPRDRAVCISTPRPRGRGARTGCGFEASSRTPASLGLPRRATARAARPTRRSRTPFSFIPTKTFESAPRVRHDSGAARHPAPRQHEGHALRAPATSRRVSDLHREVVVSTREGALALRRVRRRRHVRARPPALPVRRLRGQRDLRAQAHPQPVRRLRRQRRVRARPPAVPLPHVHLEQVGE